LDVALWNFVEGVNIIKPDQVNLTHKESFHPLDLQATGAIKVSLDHVDSEIVLVFSPVNVKRLLVCFESDTVPDLAPKHHICAVHEIEHHILKVDLKRLRIDQVKVNFLVGCDLDPLVSFNEVNHASQIQFLVVPPLDLLSEFIFLKLEEQNLARAPCHQRHSINQIHLAQILIENLLVHKLLFVSVSVADDVENGDSERLTLPVE